ncbi:MAG: metal-dependent hydrolase [Magnetococcales bacterium]|nr:metal-dependent hydrolase [Magnetococcales bacterium]
MDILTQGIVGAVAAQAVANKENSRKATVIGFIAGLPADADILIRSNADSLLVLEFHRQFTHSLLFIPLGGLLVGWVLWQLYFRKQPVDFKTVFRFALAGYATSGLLDACTSYGTQLLWPFSDARIAWSIVSVVDPLFTGLLIVCLILGWKKTAPRMAQIGMVLGLSYLVLGVVQQGRAEAVVRDLAQKRGHTIERLVVKPTMGNLILWRGVYEHQARFYIDAVRVCYIESPQYQAGGSVAKFDAATPPPGIDISSTTAQDIVRFNRFSDGYLSWHPERMNVLGDVRYALLPTSPLPLWGIELDQNNPENHVEFKNFRDTSKATIDAFMEMLTGEDAGWERMG